MRFRTVILAIALVVVSVASHSQDRSFAPETGRPAFEIASVKPSINSDAPVTVGEQPGGRFVMVNGLVTFLIGFAYVPGQAEILGLPEWVERARYDVNARASEDVPVAQLRLMMQSLLADRFGLRMHAETREADLYRLTVARADRTLGPQLRRVDVDCAAIAAALRAGVLKVDDIPSAPNGARQCRTTSAIKYVDKVQVTTLRSGGAPLAALAGALRNAIDRPIADETGLSGFYEYTIEYTSKEDPASGNAIGLAPSVFSAVQEQLGLKLEPVRSPTRVFVVDSIERPTQD